MCHKIFEAWKTFFSNSYLGVLRLFLRVLEVARSRRLGSVGEVSVWPDPVLHKNQPVSVSETRFFVFFRSAQEFGRAFFLLEKRSLVDFPIRKVRAREFVRARRGRGFFSTQRLQICEDWVLSTQSSPAVCAFGGWSRPEDGRVRRIFSARIFSARIWAGATRPGFSLHRDRRFVEIGFIYRAIADTLVLAGLEPVALGS